MIVLPPKMIYEMASGSARMLSYLAEIGYASKATNITRERQDKSQSRPSRRFPWGNSEGVHLDCFEPATFYNLVISVAIASGTYEFSYDKDGKTVTVPARFSFAYKLDGNKWKIIDHHSSTLPE